MVAPGDLFELEGLTHRSLFNGINLVWDALDEIKGYTAGLVERDGANAAQLNRHGVVLPATVVLHEGQAHYQGCTLLGGDPTKGEMKVRLPDGREVLDAAVVHAGAMIMDGAVHLAPGCKVEPGAFIAGPSYIGPGSEVRQGAYLRGACLIGARCVVGHTTEVKNSVMLDGAKAGHFAYLGDSILGREVNLGAGTKLANLKIIERPYSIKVGEDTHVIKRRKFGAIMGDDCQTGCNSVTNPGTVLGRRCLVAPCKSVPPGYYRPRSVVR